MSEVGGKRKRERPCDDRAARGDNALGNWQLMEVPEVDEEGKALSKNQIKKLKKKKFLVETRAARRKQKVEQKKKKREVVLEEGGQPPKRFKRHIPVQSQALSVYIDCDWEDEMTDKESFGVARQLIRCYARNRRMGGRIKLRATGVRDQGIIHKYLLMNKVDKWEQVTSANPEKLSQPEQSTDCTAASEQTEDGKEMLESEEKVENEEKAESATPREAGDERMQEEQAEQKLDICGKEEGDDVTMTERLGDDWAHTAMRHRSIAEEFELEKIRRARGEGGWEEGSPSPELVYLTGDATEELQELSKDEIYIIGGLLDHNRLKFASLERAKAMNVRIARLPIGAFIEMESRHVLAINHVFEIMLAYLDNGGDWQRAFLSVMPKRKAAKKKDEDEEAGEEEGEEEAAKELQSEDVLKKASLVGQSKQSSSAQPE